MDLSAGDGYYLPGSVVSTPFWFLSPSRDPGWQRAFHERINENGIFDQNLHGVDRGSFGFAILFGCQPGFGSGNRRGGEKRSPPELVDQQRSTNRQSASRALRTK